MSEICPAPQIPADSTDQQRSLLTCKSSVQCLSNLVNNNKLITEENRKTLESFEKDLSVYKAEKTKFLNTLDDYEKRKGDFSEYALRDGVSRDFWAKDYDGTCWWGEKWGEANDWCKWAASRQGYNGDAYSAREWGGCYGRHGNFRCGKPDDIVKKEQDDYKNAKPVFDKREPQQSDYPLKQIIPVESVAINCCSNYMNVSGSAESNVQTCNQIIEQKLNEPQSITSSPVITPTQAPIAPVTASKAELVPVVLVTKQPSQDIYPSSKLVSPPKKDPVKITESQSRRNLMIATVIIIIILLLSSSVLLISS